MWSSVLSKLWSFLIIHQLKSKQSQLMYYWNRTEDCTTVFLKWTDFTNQAQNFKIIFMLRTYMGSVLKTSPKHWPPTLVLGIPVPLRPQSIGVSGETIYLVCMNVVLLIEWQQLHCGTHIPSKNENTITCIIDNKIDMPKTFQSYKVLVSIHSTQGLMRKLLKNS